MKTSCWMTLVVNIKSFLRLLKVSLVIGSLFLVLGCAKKAEVTRLQGYTMGTQYHISFVNTASVGVKTMQTDVDARLNQLNDYFSTYLDTSVISQFNQQPINQGFSVPDEFIEVLMLSKQVYQQSKQSFDPSIGPLVELWGFGKKHSTDIPSEQAIAKAKEQLNFAAIAINGNSISKTAAVQLDFSAIAKGYAVDQIAELLEAKNIENFMVEIGGEVATAGNSPRGDSWRIGIEQPENIIGKRWSTLYLNKASVATSGDYRNYYEVDGVRYSHTIDPRTAKPITHKLSSVTVVANSVGLADAWATALNVLGEVEGIALANMLGINALFIYKTEDSFAMAITGNMQHYLSPSDNLKEAK